MCEPGRRKHKRLFLCLRRTCKPAFSLYTSRALSTLLQLLALQEYDTNRQGDTRHSWK